MENNSINKRIELLISTLDLTKNKFAKQVGVASTVIYNIIGGRNDPSFGLLSKIATNFNQVNLHWLLTGNGSVFEQEIDKKNMDNRMDEIGILKVQISAIQNRVSVIEKLLKLQ